MAAKVNGNEIVRMILTDVQIGFYETSPRIRGTWRTSWVMQLRRKPGRCRMPQGFLKRLRQSPKVMENTKL